MFVNSFVTQSPNGRIVKAVNREVKFWGRNGRRPSMGIIFFDVRINGKFYFFSYCQNGDFYYNGDYGVQNIGSCVPRVYYTVDGMQFCVTAKGRLWVKQL